MARILFVYSNPASFVRIDRDLLRERHDVREWAQPGRFGNPLAVMRQVRACDVVVGWFASWHTFWPITFASALRKPSVLIVGGFDTANIPEIDYGYQQGGVRRVLSRWVMRRATSLVVNSEYARRELEQNVGLTAKVVYHGVPDPFGELPEGPRKAVALTVSNVAWITVERKGLRAFAQASRLLPDVRFVLAGEHVDGAASALRELGGENLELPGRLPQNALEDLYRTASVYVQASRHEAFGMAVAEAMLAGCIPVVTRAGALPEVVGEEGVQVDGDAEAVARGIERALGLGDEVRARARRRVAERFPLDARREGLLAALAVLLP